MNKETRYSIKTKSSFNVKLKGNEEDWFDCVPLLWMSQLFWLEQNHDLHSSAKLNNKFGVKYKREIWIPNVTRSSYQLKTLTMRVSTCLFRSKVRSEFVESPVRIRRSFNQNSSKFQLEFVESSNRIRRIFNQNSSNLQLEFVEVSIRIRRISNQNSSKFQLEFVKSSIRIRRRFDQNSSKVRSEIRIHRIFN